MQTSDDASAPWPTSINKSPKLVKSECNVGFDNKIYPTKQVHNFRARV